MIRIFITCILLYSFTTDGKSQSDSTGVLVNFEIVNGDTLLSMLTSDAYIIEYINRDYRNTYQYKKTVKRIKKVYPYSSLACAMYEDYLDEINGFDSNRKKRKYLKSEEKELKEKFEGKIRDITIKEGVILLKLINRQTGHTGYEVLQELKGGTSAFLWQGVARIFSSSLKHNYDPKGDDWMIEEILQRIYAGEISVDDMTMN